MPTLRLTPSTLNENTFRLDVAHESDVVWPSTATVRFAFPPQDVRRYRESI